MAGSQQLRYPGTRQAIQVCVGANMFAIPSCSTRSAESEGVHPSSMIVQPSMSPDRILVASLHKVKKAISAEKDLLTEPNVCLKYASHFNASLYF